MHIELLNELIDKVKLIHDPGIEEDVKGFFRGNDLVEEYRLKKMENIRYKLEIILKNPLKVERERLFFNFMKFLKYSGFGIFSINNNKNEIKYTYLSATCNMDGFCFDIIFVDKML